MSGGHFEELGPTFAHHYINELADMIEKDATAPVHRAFAEHLRKVSKAVKDLDWVWSADCSPGDEVAAIMAIVSPEAVLGCALADAKAAHADLKAAIENASKPLT